MNNSERFNDPFQWFIQKTLFHKSEMITLMNISLVVWKDIK